MNLEVTLEDPRRPKERIKANLWDIDASEMAGIAQSQGHKGVRGLVSEIISKRLPKHLSHLDVVDWSFVDARGNA